MKSTVYGKWFPRRIRPQNGHGNSVGAPPPPKERLTSKGRPRRGRPYRFIKITLTEGQF